MKTIAQGVAILAMAFILGTIAHKGHADISLLAERHSGKQFWVELARYFLGNLAGGGSMSGAEKG